jgi:hypothetical protein
LFAGLPEAATGHSEGTGYDGCEEGTCEREGDEFVIWDWNGHT